MGIRRKKVSDELWERVLELRKTRKPKEVYELLKGTKSEISLSEIYRIRGPKSKKAKEASVPQEILDSLHKRLLTLPSLITQAQQEHLEGKEQRHEFGEEFHIITYSVGTGIRQLLGLFQGCFSDIDSRFRSFWCPLDGGEIAMSQLRGHLQDEVFWDRVKDFAEKAGKCQTLLDEVYKSLTTASEELAPLEPSFHVPAPDAYITPRWAQIAIFLALGPSLGFKNLPSYDPRVSTDDERNSWLSCDGLIYKGPKPAAAGEKHKQVVRNFSGTAKFNEILGLMKNLQNLRPQIIARIEQCLRRREYYHNYCPDCPVYPYIKDLLSNEKS